MGFLRRFFGPPPPKVTQLANELRDLEARMDYLDDALRKLRGRVTQAERRKRVSQEGDEADPSLQDAPGSTNGLQEVRHYPLARARRTSLRGW